MALLIPLELCKRNKPGGEAALASMIVLSFTLSRMFSESFQSKHPILNLTVPPYFWVFGIGIAARLMWPRIKPIVQGKAALWLPSYLAISFVLCSVIDNPPGGPIWLEYKTQPTIVAAVRSCLLALTLLSFAYTLPKAARLLRGYDLSYAIYLYHMLVVSTLLGLGVTPSAYWWLVIYGVAAMIALVSWRFVEEPSLRVKPMLQAKTRTSLTTAIEL